MTRLKEIAKKYGLKQDKIANIVHKSRPTISKYMTGKILPDIETYILLADYLKITLDELIGRENSYRIITIEEYNDLKTAKELLENILRKY